MFKPVLILNGGGLLLKLLNVIDDFCARGKLRLKSFDQLNNLSEAVNKAFVIAFTEVTIRQIHLPVQS